MGCALSTESGSRDPELIHQLLAATRYAYLLTQQDYDILTKIFQVRHYEKNDVIYHEHQPATQFFIISEGEVRLESLDNSGGIDTIIRGRGDALGENTVFTPGSGYGHSAFAVGDVSLLQVRLSDFKQYLETMDSLVTVTDAKEAPPAGADASTQVQGSGRKYVRPRVAEKSASAERERPEVRSIITKRRMWEEMLSNNIIELLQGVDFLQGLEEWVLQVISNLFTYTVAQPNKEIIKPGSTDRVMYIVVKGAVKVFVPEEETPATAQYGSLRGSVVRTTSAQHRPSTLGTRPPTGIPTQFEDGDRFRTLTRRQRDRARIQVDERELENVELALNAYKEGYTDTIVCGQQFTFSANPLHATNSGDGDGTTTPTPTPTHASPPARESPSPTHACASTEEPAFDPSRRDSYVEHYGSPISPSFLGLSEGRAISEPTSPRPLPTSPSASDHIRRGSTNANLASLHRPSLFGESPSSPRSSRPHILFPGHYFGEMSLIVDIPHTYAAVALEKCLLIEISINAFHHFFDVAPQLENAFNRLVKYRISEKIQRTNVPFFRAIPPSQLLTLADVAEMVHLQAGDVVVSEGEISSRFYIVMYGEVVVSVGGAPQATLKPGQYFGEIGLVTDVPRTATVTASTKAVLFAFGREEFSQCFQGQAEAYAEFSIKLSRYNAPVESVLIHPVARQYLERYCQKELSVENLHFYLAVEAFRAHHMDTSRSSNTTVVVYDEHHDKDVQVCYSYTDLCRDARYIWETYVAPGEAEQEINLKAENIDGIRQALLRAPVGTDGLPEGLSHTLFDKAQQEIMYLMRDTHQRFTRDKLFDELLESLGSYEVSTKVLDTARVNSLLKPKE